MLNINESSISDAFGWTCSPVWRKFAVNKNGTFDKGNILKEQSIKIKTSEVEICYKAYRRANNERGMNTQITASYNTKNNLIFKLRVKGNIYTPFAYLNKLQTVKINNDALDKFVIRANNKDEVCNLFEDSSLVKLASAQDLFCIEVRNGKNSDEKILYIEINGIIDDYKEIEQSFELVSNIISRIK